MSTQPVTPTEKPSLNLDTKKGKITLGGERIHLTAKEFELAALLAKKQGKTVTKEMILNHLYAGIDEPETKIIDVFVCKLRKKFKQATSAPVIETVWGRGYKIPAGTCTIS